MLLVLILLFIKNNYPDSCDPVEIKTHEEKNENVPVVKHVSFSDEAPEIKNKNGKWINTDKELTLKI